MTNKEILEFTNKDFAPSKDTVESINKMVSLNPDVSYLQIDDDKEPELKKIIGISASPAVFPCYVAIVDGKVKKIVSGEPSEDDINSIFD